mmetsp:Transcript_110644/g.356975  ORF Transcript_110644/g.356975 Transcript_110644/m.356975 type:complete len:332 (+) Transcript_110644:568-1563(+)
MHGESVDGVVHLEPLQQGGSALEQEGTHGANDHSRPALDIAATRSDGDQASQDAIAHASDVVLPEHGKAEHQDDQPGSCSSERRVHGHLGCQSALRRGAHCESGTAIEAVPAEPQDEGAQDDQRQTVRGEGLTNVGVKATVARANNNRANECSDTAAHVDDTAAGKVQEAGRVDVVVSAPREPAIAPSPVHNHRVDPGGHDDSEDRVARELHTLGHATADDGCSSGTEGPLEEPVDHGVRRCELAVLINLCEAMAEKLSVVREGVVLIFADAIGEAPTERPPAHGADTHIHQVFHQDVLHILRAAAAGLHHCETSLHEHHHSSAQDQPRVV